MREEVIGREVRKLIMLLVLFGEWLSPFTAFKKCFPFPFTTLIPYKKSHKLNARKQTSTHFLFPYLAQRGELCVLYTCALHEGSAGDVNDACLVRERLHEFECASAVGAADISVLRSH